MKTNKLILGLYIVIFLIQAQVVSASTFLDVSYSHTYSTAISYLESNNIVQGYPDGTFKPENTINRVEFLKIVLEGTRVPLDSDIPAGFIDTDEYQWYGPYIRKAKSEGWIQGYPDGTFKPLNPINKVEALKILGEVQQWDRLPLGEVPEAPFKDTYRYSWYSPYVYFAKENGILFAETDYLFPAEPVTRGYMAELVYRSIIKDVSTFKPQQTAETIISSTPAVITPANFTTIDQYFFNNIKLSETLPNVFYKNEIYLIEGDITDGKSYDMIFAFLSENINGRERFHHFIGEVKGSHFIIPIVFENLGTYSLGIIPGNNGGSKVTEITVVNGIPAEGSNKNTEIPEALDIDFENDTTSFFWTGDLNNVFRIYFIQENTVQYYFVRNKESLDIFYKNFWKFKEGNVKWRVYGAQASSLKPTTLTTDWAKSSDYSFNAVTHNFKLSDEEAITTIDIPEELPLNAHIVSSGTTHENIFDEGAVITPDKEIEKFNILTLASKFDYYGNPVIPAESEFSFRYSPLKTGTYILEINSQSGSAVVNTPVYIGNIIPFIPDFFDLQDPLEVTDYLDLSNAREELLTYINFERATQGLNAVSMRDDLNYLAQAHSQDMFSRNFFSHINPDNESPEDRRIRINVKTDVGENLAYSPTVYFGHQSLLRSAIHRENIMNPEWDSVGIGIVKDESGYLLISEEFSHKVWTAGDLESFENSIIDALNQKRSYPFTLNADLREVARSWTNDMISQNFFSFTSPSGINLIDRVHNQGYTQEGKAFILMEGSLDSLKEKLINEDGILNSVWKIIGIGVKTDEWSTLYLTVIYTY